MSKSVKLALFTIPLVLFLGLVVLFWSRIGEDPSVLPSARMDKDFPGFALPLLQDPSRQASVADMKGQVALVNVWATWCSSCWAEHKVLLEMAAQGVNIYGINYKDERDAALAYLEKQGNPFRLIVADETGGLGLDLGVTGAPETFLIDAAGVIRFHYAGIITQEYWQKELGPRYKALVAAKGGQK